jgi:hypothetical protein
VIRELGCRNFNGAAAAKCLAVLRLQHTRASHAREYTIEPTQAEESAKRIEETKEVLCARIGHEGVWHFRIAIYCMSGKAVASVRSGSMIGLETHGTHHILHCSDNKP